MATAAAAVVDATATAAPAVKRVACCKCARECPAAGMKTLKIMRSEIGASQQYCAQCWKECQYCLECNKGLRGGAILVAFVPRAHANHGRLTCTKCANFCSQCRRPARVTDLSDGKRPLCSRCDHEQGDSDDNYGGDGSDNDSGGYRSD